MTDPSTTRERIIDAARETVAAEGVAATSARAIARRGGFNQALIFYHFGSVTALLLEAFRATSDEQVEKYRSAAAEVTGLVDLVAMARRLHAEDLQSGSVAAITQLMAAATPGDEVGAAILDGFGAWIQIVEESLIRATPPALQGLISTREAAYAISAMFLGIELMERLDPERSEAEAVFEMMGDMASLASSFLPSLIPKRMLRGKKK